MAGDLALSNVYNYGKQSLQSFQSLSSSRRIRSCRVSVGRSGTDPVTSTWCLRAPLHHPATPPPRPWPRPSEGHACVRSPLDAHLSPPARPGAEEHAVAADDTLRNHNWRDQLTDVRQDAPGDRRKPWRRCYKVEWCAVTARVWQRCSRWYEGPDVWSQSSRSPRRCLGQPTEVDAKWPLERGLECGLR